MKFLVTGSAGHLGEALVRTLHSLDHEVVGLDILKSPFTTHIGSISERSLVTHCMKEVQVVFHAATLHKPHIATHSRQEFVDTNITGTLNLLEAAVSAGVKSFVHTSTTSVFGDALVPPSGHPAAWITEDVTPVPKNIYGATKAAAEDLCQLFHRNQNLPCIVLRTSRFFPEEDDNQEVREAFSDLNSKANEYLYRRVDIEDVVSAHLLAAERAPDLGFRRYIVSATTPFHRDDLEQLRHDAPGVVRKRVPDYEVKYSHRGWKMFPGIERVYVNERARDELRWLPQYDFTSVINSLNAGVDFRSPLARAVGAKGYHNEVFSQGPYPVDDGSIKA
ncbi:NAD-dependent epimerase/dehydratase family protein [Tunturiibacter gelidoferens]|uniref:UDP-glucose 4-epimerase n=2 Tax=Tunturiibacter TaxID=3154218 RepID=A0A7Y9T4J1_9BACT|nr:NAD(P)-dependent oxidoreductase [Edaphobacter lichenicola]MBB5339323.1 UDP-glucose 4-epimerase [Edaphobacter lichenicola]NYF51419.1 UDP-glucose 4-epimerase [Edaphobacter lichenicola]